MTFEQWLFEQGWGYGLQRFNICRVCKSYGDSWGLRSPRFAFYHKHCLEKSSRGEKLRRKFEKITKSEPTRHNESKGG